MHIIVGIDTGKTVAIAILDLNGNFIFSDNKQSGGIKWLIKKIENIGTPSIIASDKKPNDIIKKVASAFNCKIFYIKTIKIKTKRKLTKSYNIINVHERDALSAALKAYYTYLNKLNQAEHIAKINNIQNIDNIKAKIINNYSINEAINDKYVERN
jgi:predicted RNase H-like nuclease (RuvC/YqgF family)